MLPVTVAPRRIVAGGSMRLTLTECARHWISLRINLAYAPLGFHRRIIG